MELLVLFLSIVCMGYFYSNASDEEETIQEGAKLSVEKPRLAQSHAKSEAQETPKKASLQNPEGWVDSYFKSNLFWGDF